MALYVPRDQKIIDEFLSLLKIVDSESQIKNPLPIQNLWNGMTIGEYERTFDILKRASSKSSGLKMFTNKISKPDPLRLDPYGINEDVDFIEVTDYKKLNNYLGVLKRSITVPKDRDYWYDNGKLNFRLTSGSTDNFDFSKAVVSRNIFEIFWELWESNPSGVYSSDKIKERFKKRFKGDIGDIGSKINNIRNSIINKKDILKDRIQWESFQNSKSKWTFKIYTLKQLGQ